VWRASPRARAEEADEPGWSRLVLPWPLSPENTLNRSRAKSPGMPGRRGSRRLKTILVFFQTKPVRWRHDDRSPCQVTAASIAATVVHEKILTDAGRCSTSPPWGVEAWINHWRQSCKAAAARVRRGELKHGSVADDKAQAVAGVPPSGVEAWISRRRQSSSGCRWLPLFVRQRSALTFDQKRTEDVFLTLRLLCLRARVTTNLKVTR
jgi:hypothetical protein